MEPYAYRATCTRVIDGDTVELVVDLGFRVSTTIRGRLLDVYAPELFSGTEKDKGEHAKKYLEELVLNKPNLFVKTYKDKQTFNRWVVELFIKNDVSAVYINEHMKSFCKTL